MGMQDPSGTEWFDNYINEAYSRDVMTSYEYLKDQMNMLGISIVTILKELFPSIAKPETVITKLYSRRNQIAHQTDREHANAVQADITEEYVKARIDEINSIVMALHNAASEKG